jgi:hypothetical protein
MLLIDNSQMFFHAAGGWISIVSNTKPQLVQWHLSGPRLTAQFFSESVQDYGINLNCGIFYAFMGSLRSKFRLHGPPRGPSDDLSH